jgi:phage portal protein BeeE
LPENFVRSVVIDWQRVIFEAVGGDDTPLELQVASDRMTLVPGADGWPVAYDYTVGGRKHRFVGEGASAICHVKSFHPQDDHYGLSPMQAATALDKVIMASC